MSVKIYTARKRPAKVLEVNDGESLVETAGYISAEQRITNMMLAGQRLVESRRVMYDLQGEYNDATIHEFSDPTRSPNYDLADATQDAMSTNARLRAFQARQEAAQKAAKEDDKGQTTSPAE